MNHIIITTTNSIEGATIEKYFDVVTSNLVIGTGFFSDFKASFSDFFGGMSGAYRKQMDRLYQEAKDAISLKASALGANCILGFKIDFDEISGKGTSMFMISVSGTAVKIKMDNNSIEKKEFYDHITSENLQVEIFKYKWANKQKKVATKDDWDFILQNNLTDMAPDLYDRYIEILNNPSYYQGLTLTTDNFPILLANMTYNDAVNVIYKDYENRYQFALKLIQENRLFAPDKVLELVKKGHPGLAADLLDTDKAEYNKEDVLIMKEIVNVLNNIPDKGSVQTVKAGMLSSKTKDIYVCPNGHHNDVKFLFCTECGLNIKGLTEHQVEMIEKFKIKVDIVNKMLN